MEKRGISDIVTAVIMVVLALVAVGVVWSVINNLVEGGSKKVELSSSCLDVKIKTTKATCSGVNNGICDVTIKRDAGGKELGGIKLIFSDANRENTYVETISGDITPLATKTQSGINTRLIGPNKVEIAPYFLDESNNEQLCPVANAYDF